MSDEPKTLTLALNAITKPLPDDARMQGYYIGFDRTGIGAVDAILSAVAWAGKGAHGTEDWLDESDFYLNRPGLPDATTGNDLIQNTANVAAEQIRALEVAAHDGAAREAFEALVAMRNDINEHVPMPSLDSDLLQGPEISVLCATVAEAVVGGLKAARDEAAELRAAVKAWSDAHSAYARWIAGTNATNEGEHPTEPLSRAEKHLHRLAGGESQS